MAGKDGLIPKKMMVAGKRGKHSRTYWVRPEESQTVRLAKAKQSVLESEQDDLDY